MPYKDTAQFEIDEALYEVSEELALEALGGRRRSVYYRSRLERINQDLDLGLPGAVDRPWHQIYPTPVTVDTRRDFEIGQVGFLRMGDIEMRVDRLAVDRLTLEQAEYYMSDDPDASAPLADTPANYDLLNGYVLEGGGGVRERYRSAWVCFLRKRQLNG